MNILQTYMYMLHFCKAMFLAYVDEMTFVVFVFFNATSLVVSKEMLIHTPLILRACCGYIRSQVHLDWCTAPLYLILEGLSADGLSQNFVSYNCCYSMPIKKAWGA